MVSRIGSAVAEIRTGAEEQERERILQAAGEEQQCGQFDDVERQQRRRIDRLQPLHRVEGDLQREIEQRRQADDGDAGNDGDVEFQPLRHDEDRGELAERRQPAQPQDRIETDIAARMAEIGGGNVGHAGSLAARRRDHKFARACLKSAASLAASVARAASMPGHAGHDDSCTRRRDGPMNGPKWSIARPRQRHRPRPIRQVRRDRRRASGQALQDHPRGRRRLVPDRARQHHRPARRQRRRQDHDHRHDHGAGAADLGPHPGARPCRCRTRAPRCSAG